ncbi:hypothetical protein GPECTOR_20g583 [Gonium pectorale]|uniref:Glycosyltransferase family 92 protein n=1 Tax=Gonium pectorale TaxID=33097 RepID=A0A150GIW0_GONPE|nr:hypothetical protein GPECTOR_20g583 [Gonium pectorale]|eukprot:KXZ49726.1 hypothetical protein GPECTOR_20g583 [Gonium pectorale]
MPHQKRDTLRLLVWADDPADLHRRNYGHLQLPVAPDTWQPALLLETEAPAGTVLRAELEATPDRMHMVSEPQLRPWSYRVELPEGVGECFKLVEASYPLHKTAFCLPPASEDALCRTLAPPDRHGQDTPALWMAVGPVRSTDSNRTWGPLHDDVAARVMHHVSYHVAMGANGVLLYTDELNRHYLGRHPVTSAMVDSGVLSFVHWDMPERSHDASDGRGRVLGYNYDQALVAAHAMLGLSACGTNLALLVSDLDEFLYSPRPNTTWPEPYTGCLRPPKGGNGAGGGVALHALSRTEVLSSSFTPDQEPGLWGNAPLSAAAGEGGQPGGADGGGGARRSAAGAIRPVHPLVHYDRISTKRMPCRHNKPVVLPAAEVVVFFVHEGVPLHMPLPEAYRPADPSCLRLLHVPNAFRRRTGTSHYSPQNAADYEHFEHWLLGNGRAAALAAQWLAVAAGLADDLGPLPVEPAMDGGGAGGAAGGGAPARGPGGLGGAVGGADGVPTGAGGDGADGSGAPGGPDGSGSSGGAPGKGDGDAAVAAPAGGLVIPVVARRMRSVCGDKSL